MSILLDTGLFFGAYNTQDALHGDALAIYVKAFEGEWGGVYTSDYIIDETCTLLKAKADPVLAQEFLKAIRESKGISVIGVYNEIFEESCKAFERYHEKPGLNFTDATTIALMEGLGIEHLGSFDHSFNGIAGERIGEGYSSTLNNEERERMKALTRGGENP